MPVGTKLSRKILLTGIAFGLLIAIAIFFLLNVIELGTWFPVVVLVMLLAPVILVAAAAHHFKGRPLDRARRGLCTKCGYDRRGLAADVGCPECGTLPAP